MIQLVVADETADTAHLNTRIGLSLLYMLVIPAIVPATLSAYSVVGEREQGTFEPVLTTPIHREEFLIGNVLSAFVPALVIAYMVFGIFLAAAALCAHPVVAGVGTWHPVTEHPEDHLSEARGNEQWPRR
jgi:ABC-type Na+ efflux pump permease subunit